MVLGYSVGQMVKLMKELGKMTFNMAKGILQRKANYHNKLNMKTERE
jgi:hypothetical protein